MKQKSKASLSTILKVAIVCTALVVVVLALFRFFSDPVSVRKLQGAIFSSPLSGLVVLLLMPLNWLMEAAKWRMLLRATEPVSLKEAMIGILCGLVTGSVTPNRAGEFAGRIFNLRNTPIRDGITLTVISSVAQTIITVAAGICGLLLFGFDEFIHTDKALLWSVIVLTGSLSVLLFLRYLKGRGSKYAAVARTVKPVTLLSVFTLSGIRYTIYAMQFFLLLRMCGVETGGLNLVSLIAVNYLVVSVIPSFMITEMLVRGTVASGIIGSVSGIPEAAALAAVMIWILNIGLPVIAGVFFIYRLKFFKSEK